ncbi:MAG: basic secretory protein-like protein [Chthoniobacteraceae bacterium]
MKPLPARSIFCAVLAVTASIAIADVTILVDHGDSAFAFSKTPAPSKQDAATDAKFSLVDGERDENGGELDVLHDGKLPRGDDSPRENFFFAPDTNGGRIGIDLGHEIAVKQVNTYSRHRAERAPQLYKLYASDGKAAGFQAAPKGGTDPAQVGWKLLAEVDTRGKETEIPGGAYSVSIANSTEPLGRFRHVLFDISQTRESGRFSNTFFSEIDVVEAEPMPEVKPISFTAADGKTAMIIDAADAPDLRDWAERKLKPVVAEWYPKIVAMLRSKDLTAPDRVMIVFKSDMGGTPAYATGNTVSVNTPWFRKELDREARGAVVHELVHVVQQYGSGRRKEPSGRPPGWLVEGIPDYIRWFLYEPETHGAEIKSQRALERARYDASYRTTANFLNWVVSEHGKEVITKLNAACREGEYREELWKELTGETVQELGEKWKAALRENAGQ